MHISSLSLTNFRCFGASPTAINFQQDLTCLIGNNASGKTAVFQALNRLFGLGSKNRRVIKEDFFLSQDANGLANETELVLDVVFEFPELESDSENRAQRTVPEFFRHMQVTEQGHLPKARMQLRATWEDDGTSEGSISEELRWVDTLENDFDWQSCLRVKPADRAAVQFIYVPAKRDAVSQASTLLKSRLWRAANWSARIQSNSLTAVEELQTSFSGEAPVKLINDAIAISWQELNTSSLYTKPEVHLLENSFETLIQNAAFMLTPDEAGKSRPISSLSDGQLSLFHIALVAATLTVEENAVNNANGAFNKGQIGQTALTLLAVEEPENNLSPFYLSKIVGLLKNLSSKGEAQSFISSHSPAIMSRIEPKQVCYLRLDAATRTSSVKSLSLPEEETEANKYVRLAVKAYPELYFARFVVLGEGDSELLVIPRVAEAMGLDLDPSFVPVVPLNGRYVEHFWTLLKDLEIPYATLIDLDLGRVHGGIKLLAHYKQLLQNYQNTVVDYDLSTLENANLLTANHPALQAFQEQGLFFCNPIDIDFSMLNAFTEEYESSLSKGQRGPQESSYNTAIQAVVKTDGNADLYKHSFIYDEKTFAWYRYLFLGSSKPDTHLQVLAELEDEELKKRAPVELVDLVKHVAKAIGLNNAN